MVLNPDGFTWTWWRWWLPYYNDYIKCGPRSIQVSGSRAARPDRCCVGHQVVMKKTRLYLYYQMKGSCWGLTDEAIWTYVTIIIQPLQKFENPSLPLHHSIPRFFMWYSNEGKKEIKKGLLWAAAAERIVHINRCIIYPHTRQRTILSTLWSNIHVSTWPIGCTTIMSLCYAQRITNKSPSIPACA